MFAFAINSSFRHMIAIRFGKSIFCRANFVVLRVLTGAVKREVEVISSRDDNGIDRWVGVSEVDHYALMRARSCCDYRQFIWVKLRQLCHQPN